ncbi:MAG: AAA family ATPase [Verrucomicrobia bacterium]|jgi:hypothetical protein|nr:AAA family ATPase [Verrucomicrobiota bacterium]MDI9380298.1 AAA family ATPase [Verrucomicrobiota bacterium]OQC66941.1 MAG: hypothetical protein BWX48_01162 [Verrucomicrobia bacterium ADurb.Bin006]HOF49454.1 AAA family ATPase [Verrucomicrobiota bacterium]
MYWDRQLAEVFQHARRLFPAVLVTGPRQSGKTTFLQHEAADAAYVSFDDPLQRQFATADPNGFLDQFGERPVVLDEVQYVPALFSYLKLRIDARRQLHGRFLLSGSQKFGLMHNMSDSLAGRVALLDLLPFAAGEIRVITTGLCVASDQRLPCEPTGALPQTPPHLHLLERLG